MTLATEKSQSGGAAGAEPAPPYYVTAEEEMGLRVAASRGVEVNKVPTSLVVGQATSFDDYVRQLMIPTRVLELARKASAIRLSGWRIVDDGGVQVYNLSGTIAAKGYFLIERSQAATSVTADLLASGLSLANTGDSLELQDAGGGRVDSVNYTGGAWYAGSTTGSYTMERKLEAGGGSTPSNWASNNGVVRNGTNSGGGTINGTPRAKNSATP